MCLVSFSIKCRQCQSRVSMDECLLNDNSVECYNDESCFSTSYAIHRNLNFYQKGCIPKNRCTDIDICGSPARCKVRVTSNIKCYSHAATDVMCTTWKVSRYGVISGLYFPVFELNAGKYGPEITTYLDTFQAMVVNVV